MDNVPKTFFKDWGTLSQFNIRDDRVCELYIGCEDSSTSPRMTATGVSSQDARNYLFEQLRERVWKRCLGVEDDNA